MDIVETIARKNCINEKFYNGKPMDKEQRLFMSDNYVIKIYYPKKYNYYYNELNVYNGLRTKSYIPRLFYCGEENDYKYIIISRENGKSLFDLWNKLSYYDKIKYLKDMAIIIKDINNLRSGVVDFKNIIKEEYNCSIKKINYTCDTLNIINKIFDDNIDYINNSEKSSLIHIDTHFYNFMVNKNGKLIAYDFENIVDAPIDYQFVRLYRMNYYPESFIYPKDSLTQKQIDEYKIILPTIIQSYPEIIMKNTDYRLKVYLLNYLLKEVIRCKIPEDKAKEIIFKNQKIKLRG